MLKEVCQVENPFEIKKYIGSRKPYWLFLVLVQILLVIAPYVLGRCISALGTDLEIAKLLLMIYVTLIICTVVGKGYQRSWIYLFYNELDEYCEDIWKFQKRKRQL